MIAGRLHVEQPDLCISHEAIYQYIYHPDTANSQELIQCLVRAHRKRRRKGIGRKARKTKIPNRVPIDDRPAAVEDRIQFGHWEGDSLVSRKSRYVLSWEVSTTLDKEFCISALEKALTLSKPEIFNSDQGNQFTSTEYTGIMEQQQIAISMDGRGRALDNIFVERLWRSVKYEEMYLRSSETVKEARQSLARYFHLYNTESLHKSLDYRTPQEVYFEGQRAKKEDVETTQTQAALHQIQPSFLS